MHGDIAALVPGEQRVVVFRQDEVRRRSFRLLGPSPELCPLLQVTVGKFGLADGCGVVPDADGRFVIWGESEQDLYVWTRSQRVRLVASQGQGETLLRPEHQLVALGMVGADGERCKFSVHDGPRQSHGTKQLWSVLVADDLSRPLFLSVAEELSFAYTVANPAGRDVVLVDQQEAPTRYELEVVMTGEKPSDAVCEHLCLYVFRGDDCTDPADVAQRMVFEPRGDGPIRLMWGGSLFDPKGGIAVDGEPTKRRAGLAGCCALDRRGSRF